MRLSASPRPFERGTLDDDEGVEGLRESRWRLRARVDIGRARQSGVDTGDGVGIPDRGLGAVPLQDTSEPQLRSDGVAVRAGVAGDEHVAQRP